MTDDFRQCFWALQHAVIYHLFIESYSGLILVPLHINNKYSKEVFNNFVFECVHNYLYNGLYIIWVKNQNVKIISKLVLVKGI